MAVPQPKFREIVLQLLYSYDIGRSNPEDMIEILMKEVEVTKKTVKEAQVKADKILAALPELDKKIADASTAYNFERIQSVERNVLRLSLYELFIENEIPPKVAISEGIRLAKKFASPEGAKFVNALLDTIYKNVEGKDET
ncbi:MAG: transcription antitermination factor NusB [Chlamydia sp. 32-24]|nr:MAG: transcription antitermination factor NusB [Chlamydia sp. 32-24]